MAKLTGKLGSVDAATAATVYAAYTVPSGTYAVANIRCTNRLNQDQTVRVGVGSNAPGAADYIEYDRSIPAFGVLEDTGIAMSANEIVTVRASAGSVSVRVHGYQKDV